MSASSAKVSRKENSNHDGADETSGNVKEWRLSCTTPFSFVFRHFVIFTFVCCLLSNQNDMVMYGSIICIFLHIHIGVKCCCGGLFSSVACQHGLTIQLAISLTLHWLLTANSHEGGRYLHCISCILVRRAVIVYADSIESYFRDVQHKSHVVVHFLHVCD